jgi:hypothetical protein
MRHHIYILGVTLPDLSRSRFHLVFERHGLMGQAARCEAEPGEAAPRAAARREAWRRRRGGAGVAAQAWRQRQRGAAARGGAERGGAGRGGAVTV